MSKTPFSKEIPLNERDLVTTAGQIFSMRGRFRDALIEFGEHHREEANKQKDYVEEQINWLTSVVPEKSHVRLHRTLTHQRKKIKIDIQVYREIDQEKKVDTIKWCVVGKDLQEVFRFLPKARNHDGSLTPPARGTNHSRWYPFEKNANILRRIAYELRLLQVYISEADETVESRGLVDESESMNVSGVLDLDIGVDYSVLKSFEEITQINLLKYIQPFSKNKGNPYLHSRGRYIYNKNGTAADVTISVVGDLEIPGVHKTHMYLLDDMSNFSEFKEMLINFRDSTDRIAMMSVNHHSLFWIKFSGMWYLCDPWKKRFSPGVRHHEVLVRLFNTVFSTCDSLETKVCWMFLPRDYSEQHIHEGSCSVASLSRIVQLGVLLTVSELKDDNFDKMTVKEFHNLVNRPIESWGAMLASCLVRSHQMKRR